jgi:hypothetical protein
MGMACSTHGTEEYYIKPCRGKVGRKEKIGKIGVFCDVTPCGSCKNRSFGGT